MLSLPLLAETTTENIPGRVPYLFADAVLEAAWRSCLANYGGLKIGIAWQGATTFAFDQQRSIPLAAFPPLATLPEVQLFSLQKGEGTEQLTAVGFSVINLAAGLDQNTGAFQDTAAVMKNLDLVITSDTAIAHLAGVSECLFGWPLVWFQTGAGCSNGKTAPGTRP